MKTNKVPQKSKFVYPDKLYAICKNNKTLDISYAPQNMEAIEYTRTDAIINGVTWADVHPYLTVDDVMFLDALLIERWNKPSDIKYEEVLNEFNKRKK